MGTTVGEILISYDVSDKNPEVKAALIGLGYMKTWKNQSYPNGGTLPNTTLWHKSKTSDQGLRDMQNVCKNLNVTLEKAISVRASEFAGF